MKLHRACCCILCLLATTALLAGVPQEARVHRWRADLETFAGRYSQGHPAPFRVLPEGEFQRRVAALQRDLSSLKDHEIAARWLALVAALGDEHLEVDFSQEFGALALPVEIQTYPDGTFIVGAAPPCEDLLGSRLDRLEGRPLAELRQAMKAYVPFHQAGWFRHVFDESFGTWPLLMDAAGIVKVKERWTLEGTSADGRAFSREVSLSNEASLKAWAWEARQGKPPLRDRHPDRPFFFDVMVPERVLFLRLRSCEDSRRRPFKAVLARAMKIWRNSRLERFVVDLRGNTGGSEALVERLVSALQKDPRLGSGKPGPPERVPRPGGGGPGGDVEGAKRPGGPPRIHIWVLTDGAVFSAAAVAAWRLRHEAGARLVGEACGASANHFGNVEDVRLPSGRVAGFGTQIHIINAEAPDDFTSPIRPDIEIQLSHEDVLRGKDSVLAAALGE